MNRTTVTILLALSLLPASLHADRERDWQVMCKQDMGNICQAISKPSPMDGKTMRIFVWYVKDRPHVVMLCSDQLSLDTRGIGMASIQVDDDNGKLELNYVDYGSEPGLPEKNPYVLVSAANTPLLSQMKAGQELKVYVMYDDGAIRHHTIGLMGFTRAFSRLQPSN